MGVLGRCGEDGGGCFLLQRGVFCVSIFVYSFKMETIR